MDMPMRLKPEDRPGISSDDPTINRVELVGFLGRDPEKRFLTSGEPVIRFSLATHRWRRDTDGVIEEHTDWHQVVVMDGDVATCDRLRRGDLVRVVGELRTRSWTTSRGERRWRTEVLTSLVRPMQRQYEAQQALLPLERLWR